MLNCFKTNKRKSKTTPWFDVAKSEVGEVELPGPEDNKRIVEYHQATTLKASDDETPWCASFVCWCLEISGFSSTRSASARSFLGWGKKINLKDAQRGDIVIFKRGNSSWQGHVAFFVKDIGTYLEVLGGNQTNAVRISRYKKSSLLGIRRPIG